MRGVLMAIITSYSTLQPAVADYLARDDLTSYIPNFIQNAENKLYRTLNLRNEETALSVSISSGVAAVPSDFKALKIAYVSDEPVRLLKWVSLNELYTDYPYRSSADIPYVISREGANFVFGPSSLDGTLEGIYYAKLSALSDTNTTNWYTDNAPEVLLYGALLESAPFIKDDPRLIVWQQLLVDAVESLDVENRNAQTSMGPLIQRIS